MRRLADVTIICHEYELIYPDVGSPRWLTPGCIWLADFARDELELVFGHSAQQPTPVSSRSF